ncbi:MAG: hypothetical protein QM731_14525 [Chitinophagaceae bacterium]
MSRVTNMIFSFSISEDEEERIKEVNAYQYRGLQMNLISADFNKDTENRTVWYGGSKFLETPLYVGAFNYFDLEPFIEHFKTIKWEEPEYVQVIVKEQEENKFKILDINI